MIIKAKESGMPKYKSKKKRVNEAKGWGGKKEKEDR